MELERYRTLDKERRKWETRESRVYARLEAVEEELRTSRAAAGDAEDNELLREQLRTLTSDLNSVQSLVESLTAASWLVQENGALGRENLSVQRQRARLAGSQRHQERQGVDTNGGLGTHAHRTTTTRRLSSESLLALEQPTGPTRRQSDHERRSAEPDRGCGTRARWTTAVREPQNYGEETRMSRSEAQRITSGESYSGTSLGTLSQGQMLERGGDRTVVGEGEGGEQTRDVGEEGLHSSDHYRGLTPATLRMTPSAAVVRTIQATGLDTLTTFSANRPQTVTFDGPISHQTVSETGSMTAVVSGGYREGTHGVYGRWLPPTPRACVECAIKA